MMAAASATSASSGMRRNGKPSPPADEDLLRLNPYSPDGVAIGRDPR